MRRFPVLFLISLNLLYLSANASAGVRDGVPIFDREYLIKNAKRIQFDIVLRNYYTLDDFKRHYTRLRSFSLILETTEFDQLPAATEIWSSSNLIADLCKNATDGRVVKCENRDLYFSIDKDIPPVLAEVIIKQAVEEVASTTKEFNQNLNITPDNASIVFIISKNREVISSGGMDIGGLTMGSFIWLPVEYISLDDKLKVPLGLLKGALKHEIVHVLMNQAISYESYLTLPHDFYEGTAIFLARNSITERYGEYDTWRLSHDYIELHHLFKYLEARFGVERVDYFIEKLIKDQSADYYRDLQSLTKLTYQDLLKEAYTSTEKVGIAKGIVVTIFYIIILIIIIGIIGLVFLKLLR